MPSQKRQGGWKVTYVTDTGTVVDHWHSETRSEARRIRAQLPSRVMARVLPIMSFPLVPVPVR